MNNSHLGPPQVPAEPEVTEAPAPEPAEIEVDVWEDFFEEQGYIIEDGADCGG